MSANQNQMEVINHASAVADYDFNVEDDTHEEMKFEMVSHVCSQAISAARIEARMSQTQLATACNEKAASIVALENGSARYDASLINRIEVALKVQIPRGR